MIARLARKKFAVSVCASFCTLFSLLTHFSGCNLRSRFRTTLESVNLARLSGSCDRTLESSAETRNCRALYTNRPSQKMRCLYAAESGSDQTERSPQR